MQDLDDIALLREYLEHDSGDAFAALVTRHIGKVYSIALRHTRNPHQAEEIAQAVFVILASRARHLSSGVILSGWLCRTAQLTATTFVRSEIRRARREQEAYMQNLPDETPTDLWAEIEPLLDRAMAGLNEADYQAVVLRFFDGKSMKDVGAALGASEDAAKMRVHRAVEKLRSFFTRKNIFVPTALLMAALSANSVQSAPATLAKTAASIALGEGATASAQTLTLIKEVLKIMAWTKAKTILAVAAVTLLLTGTATVIVQKTLHHQTVAFANNLRQAIAGHAVPEHNPNARFANSTPEQRVQQARRHFPESVDDLRK